MSAPDPKQPKAAIEAEFSLVDDQDGAGKIVFQGQCQHSEAVTPYNGDSLATGWGQALRSVFLALGADLEQFLADAGEQE